MFDFLLPKYVRQGRNILKDATKMLAYKRDLWSDATVLDYKSHLRGLEDALRQRNEPAVAEHAQQLDAICAANLPPVKDAAMRENVEVFLVAIVVALGVRTYFLQPFTIPTGSMQPTLNGILGYATDAPPPNPLVRIFEAAWAGRSYVNVVAEEDCTVVGLREFKTLLPFLERTPLLGEKFGLFTRTEIITAKRRSEVKDGTAAENTLQVGEETRSYVVKDASETVARYFLAGKPPGSLCKAGEPIARGYIETGDHVFVDKFSYHFRTPQRADVFVFNTQNVPTNENRLHPGGPSQFYIKRLGGLPGDELRIANPQLFVNGQPAGHPSFRRVIEKKEPGYEGYCNGREVGFTSGIMSEPDIAFNVPPKNYFALGDNSYHSSDSRDWGPVPQQNIMGRGVLVYWPFGRHWGLIR
jgi:signal peptidase I